jgi:hypothetical protein
VGAAFIRINSDVLAIGNKYPESLEPGFAKRGDPFPLMAYFPGADAIHALYNSVLIGSPHRLTERYHDGVMIMAESYRTQNLISYSAGSRKTFSVVTQVRSPEYIACRYP